jgi:hypothetical protein
MIGFWNKCSTLVCMFLFFGLSLAASSYKYPVNFPDSNKYCDQVAASGTYRKIIRSNPDLNGKITYHGQKLVDYDLASREFLYQVTFSFIKNKRNVTSSYLADVYFKEGINRCLVRSISLSEPEK